MKKLSIVLLSAAFIALLAYQTYHKTPRGSGSWREIPLATLDGGMVALGDFAGKILIVDFWATWCPPCKKEIPGFIRLYDRYKNRGVEIVGLVLESGPAPSVRQFVAANRINYHVFQGNREIVEAFGGIQGYPTTFIIDRGGTVRQRFVGYRPESVFEDVLEKLLAEAPAEN